MEEWTFSSFKEYTNNAYLYCNKEIAELYLGIGNENFYDESYKIIDEEKIKNLY
ncbi:MAG: hypothetical protein JWN78_964 [Bacteroidota bacterium]|nr:hypothetical protein [Bacteroidota bacterium]